MTRVLLALVLVLLPTLLLAHLEVHDLQNGVLHTGLIPVSINDEDSALRQDYFRFWVPENAVSVTLEFTSNNYWCTMYAYYRTLGLPCPPYSPYYDAPCYDESQYLYDGAVRTIYKAYYSSFRFVTEGYWYIGLGREYLSDYDEMCPYNITATYTACPGVNETDWNGYGDVADCAAKLQEDMVPPVPGEWSVMDQALQSFDVVIPDDKVGVFTVWVNTTDYYLDIHGYSWGPATYYGNEDGTYDYTTETIDGTTYYYHRYDTFAPRPGRYNVLIMDRYSSLFNATVRTWYTTCMGDTVGPNCTGVVHDPSDPTPITRSTVGYDYWKIMVPANSSVQFNLSVTDVSGGGYGYVFMKLAGWPFYDSQGGYDNTYYYNYFSSAGVLVHNLYAQDAVTMATVNVDGEVSGESWWYIGVYTYTAPLTFAATTMEAPVQSSSSTGQLVSTVTTASSSTAVSTADTVSSSTASTAASSSTADTVTTTSTDSSTSGTTGSISSGSNNQDASTTSASSQVAVPAFVLLCIAVLMSLL